MRETLSGSAGQKRPWLAAVLAFILPGLGHLYLRLWLRAVGWFLLIVTVGSLLIPDGTEPETVSIEAALEASRSVPPALTLVILAVTLVSVVDAYWMAARINNSDQPSLADDSPGTGTGTETGTETETETGSAPTDSSTQECPNCGREIDDELTFCHWCTTRVDETG